MSTDYTRSYADRLRAVTVAGEVANLIRQINPEPDLPTQSTSGGVPSTSYNCGLSIQNIVNAKVICNGSTVGTALGRMKVCSSIAQTVTATATAVGSGCLNLSPSTTFDNGGSTWTANAGDCMGLSVTVNYDSCITGTTGTITITLTTNSGCSTTTAISIACTTWTLEMATAQPIPSDNPVPLINNNTIIAWSGSGSTSCPNPEPTGCGEGMTTYYFWVHPRSLFPAGTTYFTLLASQFGVGGFCGAVSGISGCNNTEPCTRTVNVAGYSNDPNNALVSIIPGATTPNINALGGTIFGSVNRAFTITCTMYDVNNNALETQINVAILTGGYFTCP